MAVVCQCHGVPDRVVARAIAHGARTVDQIVDSCEVGRDCGCCLVTVEDMLASATEPERDPAAIIA